jgi:ureidoglycolate lyase
VVSIRIEPLAREAFRPFGEVIAADGTVEWINDGGAERHRGLARAAVGDGAVEIGVVVVRRAVSVPFEVPMLERHPLGTQAFVPLDGKPFLVVVAEDARDVGTIRAFRAEGDQGINYGMGVWHTPLLALEAGQRFLVVDRVGDGVNLEVCELDEVVSIG